MNLAELSALIDRSTEVRRIETFDAYASSSDHDWVAAYLRGDPKPDVETKRGWLDRLSAAAERGHPRERLRVIPRPVPDYIRYASQWAYVDNTEAGEDIRIVDAATMPHLAEVMRARGDYYRLDDRVVRMRYDVAGAFQDAEKLSASMSRAVLQDPNPPWGILPSFTEWWSANPDLHRGE